MTLLPNIRPATEEQVDESVAVFKALGDPVRLRLYLQLAASPEPVCVCDLGDVGVSQPTVSHHLRRLREAGLVDCERRGTWVYYWSVPHTVQTAVQLLDPTGPGAHRH